MTDAPRPTKLSHPMLTSDCCAGIKNFKPVDLSLPGSVGVGASGQDHLASWLQPPVSPGWPLLLDAAYIPQSFQVGPPPTAGTPLPKAFLWPTLSLCWLILWEADFKAVLGEFEMYRGERRRKEDWRKSL
ncbi:uncharacterized protein LOC118152276 [Callithrix jacchus]